MVGRWRFVDRATAALPWWLIGAAVGLLDFGAKEVVRALLSEGSLIPMAPFFNIVSSRNSGAAFSMFADAGGSQRWLLAALAIVVSLVLAWMLTSPLRRQEAWAYALILGGAIGNAGDRLAFGSVTDFLDFHVGRWHWPAFNVADIGICVGALLLVVSTFTSSPPRNQLNNRLGP